MIKIYKKLAQHDLKKRGAVLLIAILVSSVALAVGLGVYERTYKELLFASFWKQTQIALSAADEGLECAMYWDINTDASPTCFDLPLPSGWTPGDAVTNAEIDIPTGGCVIINIEKSGTPIVTTIVARGYNTCVENNPRRVERGLGVRY